MPPHMAVPEAFLFAQKDSSRKTLRAGNTSEAVPPCFGETSEPMVYQSVRLVCCKRCSKIKEPFRLGNGSFQVNRVAAETVSKNSKNQHTTSTLLFHDFNCF